ncbi:MAG: nucleotidyltransferase domain-containing protein [Lachnospiraceae bacterium]|nr:nucleotidyltransferase domain-containing protein [Lachnospiraceae bacterium]
MNRSDNLWRNTGIREKVIEEIRLFAGQYKIERVILFGSRARGDFKERSDIDLAFQGGDTVNFSLDVDEETSTLLMFDLVDLGRPVSEELRQVIFSEGVTVYEKV